MSMTAGDIFDWLNTFKEDDLIGIDEGGLCLVEVGGTAYLEIGGVAEQIAEDEDRIIGTADDTEESQNTSC